MLGSLETIICAGFEALDDEIRQTLVNSILIFDFHS